MTRHRVRLFRTIVTDPNDPFANDADAEADSRGIVGVVPSAISGLARRPSHRERAQTLFDQRRDRARSFGVHAKVFQEAAWDLLLELFLCHEDGRTPSTTSVAYGAGVPITTALRSLKKLEGDGLIESSMDPTDTRVRRIVMTSDAVGMMRRYLDDV